MDVPKKHFLDGIDSDDWTFPALWQKRTARAKKEAEWFKNHYATCAVSHGCKNVVEDILQDSDYAPIAMPDGWNESKEGKLTSILLLNHLPRILFLAEERRYATDFASFTLVHSLLSDPSIRPSLSAGELVFLANALQHSEEKGDVELAVQVSKEALEKASEAKKGYYSARANVARAHLSVLETYEGHYPHRNLILGRESTPNDLNFMKKVRRSGGKCVVAADLVSVDAPPPRVPRGKEELPAGKRLRILVLHSFRQNAGNLRGRTNKVRNALAPIADLVYVNGPLTYVETGDEPATMDQGIADTHVQRMWWNTSDDFKTYSGIDISLSYINHLFQTQGPFDGVMGFSQGGAFAGILAAMQPFGHVSFRFFINASGFVSRADEHKDLFAPHCLYDMPSLHVIGRNDRLVEPTRTLALAEFFNDAVIIEHNAGHFAPSKWDFDKLFAFVASHMEQQNLSVAADKLSPLDTLSEKLSATLTYNAPKTPLVPIGMAEQSRSLLSTDFWKEASMIADRNLTPAAVKEFVTAALKDVTDESARAAVDDLILLAWCLRKSIREEETDKFFYWMLVELSLVDGKAVLEALPMLPKHGAWRDLCRLAENVQLRINEESGGSTAVATLNALNSAIVDIFHSQLEKDLAVQRENEAAMEGPESALAIPAKDTVEWISECAHGAPRIGARTDNICRLAKRISRRMFPLEAFLLQLQGSKPDNSKEENLKIAKGLSSNKYRLAVRSLSTLLKQSSEEYAVLLQGTELKARRQAAKLYSEKWVELSELPISPMIVNPTPEAVMACEPEELQPLLAYLRANKRVQEDTPFSKGTLMPDGRLDLCKQVVGPKGIRPLLEAMGESSQVLTLMIGNNIVGDEGGPAIAEFIEKHPNKLTTWYIAGNNFTYKFKGIEPICKILEDDMQVKALWLKRNPLKAAGMRPLASMLQKNTHLAVLDLVNCGLLDEGVNVLLSGLADNHALQHLYLSTNGITAAGVKTIASFLKPGTHSLKSLFLSCNRLRDEGACVIADVLTTDSTLKRMSLASNRIGQKGAAALAQALSVNSTLQFFDIGYIRSTPAVGELGNFIRDDGCAHFAEMMKKNTTLRSMSLMHNSISQEGLAGLAVSLASNESITHMDVAQFGKELQEETLQEIEGILQRNKFNSSLSEEELMEIVQPEHINEILSVYRTRV